MFGRIFIPLNRKYVHLPTFRFSNYIRRFSKYICNRQLTYKRVETMAENQNDLGLKQLKGY